MHSTFLLKTTLFSICMSLYAPFVSPLAAASPLKKNSPQIISQSKIRFLTNDTSVIDGRPVFSKDGKSVVFMRQPHNGNPAAPSTLYIVDIDGKSPARVLFNGLNPQTGQAFNATRPDYSWTRSSFEIAFDAVNDGIWLLDIKTQQVKQVLAQTINGKNYVWSYPAWYKNGKYLSVTNYNNYDLPFYHELVKVNIKKPNQFTPTTSNSVVWVGESSVCQKGTPNLVFAGQVPVQQPPGACTCQGGCTPDGYAQNCNQIWLENGNTFAPIDQKQGRAPWFSPNGKYVVFESNRMNPQNPDFYRLFVYSVQKKTVQVITPTALNVQHAKWSPDGKKLAFAVQLVGGAQGIAVIELE